MQNREEHPDSYREKRPAWGKGRIALTAACCVLAALLFFVAGWYARWFALGERARGLLWAVNTAERNFYKDVDEDALYADFYEAFALDPYSRYYTAEEYRAILASNEGHASGIGISVSNIETGGKTRIFRVTGNSPAEHAGLQSGMYIYAYGTDAASLESGTKEQFLAFVQGSTGPIVLSCGFSEDGSDAACFSVEGGAYEKSECLYRDNEQALRFLGETPSAVSVGGIAGLPDDTAYLRVDEFYGRAAAEAGRCLSYFKNSKKSRLILDLRSNGGGYLQTFLDLAAYFLRGAAGSRPFAAEARYKSGRTEKYYASGNFYGDYFGEDAEIYLLADENTASASECFIGALISYETLPYSHIYLRKGETARTYGKGIMQMHYTDPNGNVLKLTTAEIFWPNGKSIHGVGVTEQDGAVGIASTVLHGAEDDFLSAVIQSIAGS